MFYLYKKAKAHINNRKRTGVSSAVRSHDYQSTPQPDSAKADVEGLPRSHALPDASKDREPTNSKNARSKRRSYWALQIMGFTLAIDFTMSLMSIQPLYYLVQGSENLYGLTFGSYDLTAMIWAPFFGIWHDKSGTFKLQFLVGAVLNAIGNFIYAFTVLVDGWWMMLLARLVAGIGVATLGLGSSYLAKTTTLEQRQLKLGQYRVLQNLARMVGPFVGYIFLGLPEVTPSSSTEIKVFNWYSIPGWVAGGVVVVLIPLFIWLFTDPTQENEHLVNEDHMEDSALKEDPGRGATFRRLAYLWLALSFLTVFSTMSYFSNVFALFAGQYHQVTSQTQNWKTFIGVGVGSMVAAMVYRTMVKTFPRYWDERVMLCGGGWIIFIAWMLVIPWGGETWVPPPALFYASSGLLGFATVTTLTNIETFMSKKVTQYKDIVQDKVGWWLGVYFMALSAGRFVGPLVIGAVTRMATPDGNTHYCSQFSPDGSACIGPPEEQCIILGEQYYVQGCILYNAIIYYPIMAGLQLLVVLCQMWVVRRYWSYQN